MLEMDTTAHVVVKRKHDVPGGDTPDADAKRVECLRLLAERGAFSSNADDWHCASTCLRVASGAGCGPGVIEYLLSIGASLGPNVGG